MTGSDLVLLSFMFSFASAATAIGIWLWVTKDNLFAKMLGMFLLFAGGLFATLWLAATITIMIRASGLIG